MNEDFENMKYGDLRKYAKNLGLPNIGKKDYLIQLIKEHFEKNGASNDVVESKDDEKIEDRAVVEEKVVENKEEPVHQEPQTEKVKGKRGRKKGKTKIDEDENETDSDLVQQALTPAPSKIEEKPATPLEINKTKKEEKQSRKVTNKKELPTPIVVPPAETPKIEQKFATPASKRQISKKGANKKEQAAITPPPAEPPMVPETPATPPKPQIATELKKDEKQTRKGANKKEQAIISPPAEPPVVQETPASPPKIKKAANKRESPSASTEEQQTTARTKKIKTKKGANKKTDEEPVEPSPSAVNEQQVPDEQITKIEEKPTIIIEINSSLISNDQQIKSNDSLITNDDSTINPNTTATTAAATNINNKTEIVQKNLDKTYDCPKLPLIGSTPLVSKELNSTYDKENKMINDLENTDKKPTVAASGGGRARIVIPTENGVEVKQRAAGPRIVIPPEAENQKKATKVDNKKAKVAKPDFKTIHKKLENKLESIDNYEKRKVERHESLTGKKVVVPKKVLSEKIDNLQPKDDPPAPTNPDTKQTTQSNESSQQQQQIATTAPAVTTGIPRFIKKQEQAVAAAIRTPKTPRRTSIIKQSITTPNTIRKSAQKPRLDVAKASNNLNTSISAQVSSFSRRKSFDINASLARPVKYNPHIGKLRPVNFDSNSIFINKHKQAGAANLNSSVLSTTIQQQQQKPSRTSIIIKNKDSIKDMLHDQIRINSNAAKEKFKANEVKIRKEQRKEIQMNNRNIENQL